MIHFPAHSSEHLATVRELFMEYANSLEVDLCFQNFNQELAQLPGSYAPPEGRLFLAAEGTTPAGCVALRKIEDRVCEMKRLYVRPAFRGKAARECAYHQMRLDTLSSLKEAITLYESLGFQRIPPYYDNPSPLAVFMELRLA